MASSAAKPPLPPAKRAKEGADAATAPAPAPETGLTVVRHPVLQHKVTSLRRKETSRKHFRELLQEVTVHLGFAATGDLDVAAETVEAPSGPAQGFSLASRMALVPIMRSGLGMLDPMLTVLPMATVHHIGMYRNPESLLPVLYFNKLPPKCESDVAIVLEPQIGTGATVIAVVDLLKEWFSTREAAANGNGGGGSSAPRPRIKVVSVIASREGVDKVLAAHPDIHVVVAAVDDGLDNNLPVPGFGDPGNRMYNAS